MMFTLASPTLEVTILDPVADQERFGVRYCTGGYIFQITDATHGPLLSGPTYPHDFNWFDGQGIPDAFNLGPLRDGEGSNEALIIGVGLCDTQANTILERCTWQIEQGEHAITMTTSHAHARWALDLRRTVALHERTVRSTTTVRNTGAAPVPLRWFPHPFFPHLEDDDALCRCNIAVGMPANDWYEQQPSGWIARRGWPWTDGHFQALDHDAHESLVILQKHPALGIIAATCSYIPAFFPIWGNAYTFSWEPYLERTLGGGLETTWTIDYDF
jgi:hypothetical protein